MKKSLRMLALVLSMLLAFTGAAAAEDLTEMLLATVDGEPVAIDDAYAEYVMYADSYEMYGFGEGSIKNLREEITDYYIQLHLLYSKVEELGLSEKMDQASIEAEAEQMFEETLALYMEYYADPEADYEESRAACIEGMAKDGFTMDDAREDAYHRAGLRLLAEYCGEGIEVTDEEVRAKYDETLASQQASYAKYLSNFKSDWDAGRTIYYVPEGIRFVKHILVGLSSNNQSILYNLELELKSVEGSFHQEGADVEALTARKEELVQAIEDVYAIIMPRVEEIQARLDAGEDFLSLMDEYGEDPGMQEGSASFETGYMVWEGCSSWVEPFTEGSMSLTEVGEVTGPVRTSYGIHLIRFESELEPHTVPFEDVQESIHAEMLNDKINEAFMARLAEWEEEAEIVRFTDNLEIMRQAARGNTVAAE